jgi:hypothetical protein
MFKAVRNEINPPRDVSAAAPAAHVEEATDDTDFDG